MSANRIDKIEPAEPAIRQINMYFLAKTTLGSNTLALDQEQHPHHQLGINRRTSVQIIRWRQKRTNLRQTKEPINATQRMIRRQKLLNRKLKQATRPAPIALVPSSPHFHSQIE